MEHAEVLVEYFAFNKTPKNIDEMDEQYRYLFVSPIRVFGIGENARKYAESWVELVNKERWDAREKNGVGLEVDNAAGEIVEIVVRSQTVIRLPFRDVPTE